MLEVLPKAAPPPPRQLTAVEVARLRKHEETTLRELRLFLREILNKLSKDRKFNLFAKPVDAEDVRLTQILAQNLCLSLKITPIHIF